MSDNRYPGIGILIALVGGALIWGSVYYLFAMVGQ